MNNIFGSYDEDYSYEDLFEKLKEINALHSKTIAFTDLCDHVFKFFEPPHISDIMKLKETFKYNVPKEYIQFLKLTNGLVLTYISM